MINPINFRAGVSITPVKANEQEAPKTETVTTPIENQASFKGTEALAAYNKAILAADTAVEDEPKTPAFKGEDTTVEDEKEAPAFKGEEVSPEENSNIEQKENIPQE